MPPASSDAPPRASWRPAAKDKDKDKIMKDGDGAEAAKRRRADTAGEYHDANEDAEEGADGKNKKGKGKGKGRGRHRGGRRANHQSDTDKKLITKDKSLRTLLTLMLKMICRLSQQTRQLMGSVCDVFLIPSDHQLVLAIKAEVTTFTAAVFAYRHREEGSDQNPPGNPTPTLFLEFSLALAKLDVGGANRELINETNGKIQEKGPIAISDNVHFIKTERCKDPKVTRLVISFMGWSLRPTYLDAMLQVGLERKQGQAPEGWMEAELSEWAEALTNSLE